MEVFIKDELSILIYWIKQRESVRKKKAAWVARPWTEDPLLRDFRWCNVRRMDDRVSKWLLDNWYVQDGTITTDLTAATLARLVNWPDALLEITGGERFDITYMNAAMHALEKRKVRGDKTFTGAYIVPGVPGRSKVESVMSTVRTVSDAYFDGETMRETWEHLCKFDGIGSFLAGQIAADLAHLNTGRDWTDKATWAPLGPGSMRGMNRLMGRPKDARIKQADFEVLLPDLIAELLFDSSKGIAYIWNDRKLHAMDIQNCLCEFDKYRRLTLKEGSVRSRYDGKWHPEDDEL